jgi:hypothetical protein
MYTLHTPIHKRLSRKIFYIPVVHDPRWDVDFVWEEGPLWIKHVVGGIAQEIFHAFCEVGQRKKKKEKKKASGGSSPYEKCRCRHSAVAERRRELL